MMIDQMLVFSDAQDLTATAVSTNVLNRGVAKDLGAGEPLFLFFQFGTVVSNATWTATLKGADAEGMATNVIDILVTKTLTPTTGTMYAVPIPSHTRKQFFRVDYTLAGGTNPHIPTFAAIVKGVQIRAFSRSY